MVLAQLRRRATDQGVCLTDNILLHARAVMEETIGLILLCDRAGQVFYCNRAARTFFGIADSPATFAMSLDLLLDAATAAELRQNILPVAEDAGLWRGEAVMRRSDGESLPVWQVVQAHAWHDQPGAYYSLTAHDVTLLKRQEQARVQAEVTAAMRKARPDGLLVVTDDGSVIAVNPTFAAVVDHIPAGATGLPLATLIDQVSSPAARSGAGQQQPGAAVITLKDISSIRAAEAARRESETMAQAIIDANRSDAVFLLDPEGRVLAGNQTLAERLQRPLSEIIGRGQETLLPPAAAARCLAAVRTVLEKGEPVRLEDTRDGLIFDTTYSPVRGSYGRVGSVAVVARDVTAQRQAEEELRRLAGGLAEAQRIAHLGSWEWDIVTGEETWSDETYRIFGLQPGEIRPDFTTFLSFVHPDDRARVEQASNAAIKSGQSYDIEHRIVRRSGEVRVVRERGEVQFAASGRPLRKTGTMIDISETEQARQDLHLSEERYRSLFESSADGIFFTDMDGVVLDANRAFMVMSGYVNNEMRSLRMQWSAMLPPAWREQYERVQREQLLVHGQTPEYEQEFLRKDGTTLQVSMRMWLLRTGNGTPVGTWGIARDITERKAAEQRVAAATAEMERSNRELEQFAYVASHDLQEPLAVISGYVGLLARRYKNNLDDKADRYINFTTESVLRMQAMIRGLLQYSRVGYGDRTTERVSLNTIFTEVLQNLAAAIERTGAQVSCGELPTLTVRKYEIVRLLQNLIENALKYRAPGRAPVVRVTARQLREAWEVAVADNGLGVPPQHRDRVFQIFQRLHTGEEYPGTGIGLAICKKTVEKYGGDIRVEDNPGGGAIFRFTLATRMVAEEPRHE